MDTRAAQAASTGKTAVTREPASIDFGELPEALRERVASHWQTWRDNGGRALEGGALARTLPRVWACSEFVAKTCALHPAVPAELSDSGDLERAYAPGELSARLTRLGEQADTEQALYAGLRRVRTREAVRLAWRDLAGWADLGEVMTTMSELADAAADAALTVLFRLECERRGTPRDEAGKAVGLVVLGLGKLGGRELNFSSDIDLIFAYRADGETDGARPLSNHEFFRKLSTRLINALDKITEDGCVFRVDMRLRPNGSSGPIALSFDAMEQYYQVHGRDWERYALIKARPVAGDIRAGEHLLERLRPFVYRKYLDYGAIQSIRDMKQMIDREVRRKHGEGDIKLGRGGIREIEFIVQSLQLIRGGRDPRLQTQRLHAALARLAEIEAFTPGTVDCLASAYQFLRTVEHRLQMAGDEQTHVLPRQEPGRTSLALAMGRPDWPSLDTDLRRVKDQVHDSFQQILSEKSPTAGDLSTLEDLWAERIDGDSATALLAAAGYRDPAPTLELIHQLRRGKSYYAHSTLGRQRLDRLMPALVQLAGDTADPHQTLVRLVHFVESVGRRSAYLILLIENPQALEQLVRLCAASAWVSNWLSRYPLLLEELLVPVTGNAESFEQELDEEIDNRLEALGDDDIEGHMEAFREIHHAQVLRIAAADIFDLIDRSQVARRICLAAEKLLDAVARFCRTELGASLGVPTDGDTDSTPAFGIVGYGKLGGGELGYNSDVDLVFMHEGCDPAGATRGGRRSVSNDQYFARLAQRIAHVIATRTPSGVLYEIDSRLRPSGGSGPLVTSLPAFAGYQRERAWTWEHQALVRARMISGPEALVRAFEAVRREVICTKRDPDTLRTEVSGMRDRMRSANDRSTPELVDLKQCHGGIIDVEFLVQYFVLHHAAAHPELAGPRGTLNLLDAIEAHALMESGDPAALRSVYSRYLDIDHGCKLGEHEPLVEADSIAAERRQVTEAWRRVFG